MKSIDTHNNGPATPNGGVYQLEAEMIALIYKPGQTCNQLFYFSHFIAYAIENKLPLYNAAFYEYKNYFIATSNNNFGKNNIKALSRPCFFLLNMMMPLLTAIKKSPIHNFVRILNDQEFDIESLPKSPMVFPYGWLFRTPRLFSKYSSILRDFFTPIEPYRSNVKEIILRCRRDADILVGVHIRRGDYRMWRGGKYHYSDRDYASIMRKVAEQIDASVGFLLCSNEKISLENYENLKCYTGGMHFIEDLYSLAECDYIIGPPSTFSMWASFYGSKPYLHITDVHAPINMKDFRVCAG